MCQGNFTYKVLVSLLSGLFFGLPSLCAIVRAFTFSPSVSTLSRGIRDIPTEAILRRTKNKVAALVAKSEHPERRYVLAVDDTFVRKFGASLENCYWFDHTSGSSKQGRILRAGSSWDFPNDLTPDPELDHVKNFPSPNPRGV